MSDDDDIWERDELRIYPISAKSVPKNMPMVDPRLPQPPFLWGIVAPSGSGKTCLLCNALSQKELYNGVFDRVYIISPTVRTDEQWDIFDLHPERTFESYDDQMFNQLIAHFKRDGKNDLNSLLIVDDCAGDSQLFRQDMRSSLMRYTLRARHDRVSIIFCSQALRLIPRKLRSNLSAWTMFHAPSLDDAKDLARQVDSTVNADKLVNMIRYATAGRYSFLQATKDRSNGVWTYSVRFKEKLNPAEF